MGQLAAGESMLSPPARWNNTFSGLRPQTLTLTFLKGQQQLKTLQKKKKKKRCKDRETF